MDLSSVVENVKPTVLIGVSGQPGLFTRDIVTTMAAGCQHPIILPLSNPTNRAEATPADLIAWTDGAAIVATGSPFDPIDYNGQRHTFAQSNNVYVFPGLALGALASNATTVTDGMLHAVADGIAGKTGDETIEQLVDKLTWTPAYDPAVEVADRKAKP